MVIPWQGVLLRDLIQKVKIAEEVGVEAAFTAETWGRDQFSILTQLALQTERIKLGSGIAPVFGRSPAVLAMTFATLDDAEDHLRLVHDLAPGATQDLMALVNRLLPAADGPTERVRGMKLATALSPSPLTAMMNGAARRNNQFGGRPTPSAEHARRIGLGRGNGTGSDGIESNGRAG